MKAETTTSKADSTTRTCPACNKPFVPVRANQRCCSGECRKRYEKAKREAAKQQPKHKCRCLWCDGMFETNRTDQFFCSPNHQQAFNNFWKGWGPRFGRALYIWRVEKKPGAITAVGRLFSEAREEMLEKREEAKRRRVLDKCGSLE